MDDNFEYAWKWFSYHAEQRLKAFHFFLIFIGVIVVGLSNCWGKSNLWVAGALIYLFGIISCILFWFLEIRNEELVNYGRDALKKIEEKMTEEELKVETRNHGRVIIKDNEKVGMIIKRVPSDKREKLIKHRFVFGSIFLTTGIGFLFSLLYFLFAKK